MIQAITHHLLGLVRFVIFIKKIKITGFWQFVYAACRMLKIYRRFKMAAKTGEFFALHQWDFISKNIQELNRDATYMDRRTFPVDITQVVWDTYVKDYVFGIRNYVLKDPPTTIPQALSKLQK